MKHIRFNAALREERLLGQNANPEAAAPAPEAPKETTPQIKGTSDVINLSTAKQQKANTETKAATDKVAEANKNPMLKDIIGNVGDAALGKIEGFLKGTSAAAHNARMEAKAGSDQEKSATNVRDLTDSGAKGTAGLREDFKNFMKGETPADTAKRQETPVKTEEKQTDVLVKASKAAEPAVEIITPGTKAPNKSGDLKNDIITPDYRAPHKTSDLKKENQTTEETTKNQAKNVKLESGKKIEAKDEPKTAADRIGKSIDDSMKKFEDAKTPGEAFAALGALIAEIAKLITDAIDGTLFEEIKKPGEKKTDTPDEKKSDDARDRVTDELKDREKSGVKEPLPKEIKELRKEKADMIASNEKSIDNATKRIDGAKKDNERLVDEEGTVKKEINKLKGSEDAADVQKREVLEADLTRIEAQVKANDELIKTADAQRDKLTGENKILKEDVKELDKMSPDIDAVVKKLEDIVKKLGEILAKAKDPSVKSIELSAKAEGPVVELSGVSPGLAQAIKAGSDVEVKDQTVQVSAENFPKVVEAVQNASAGQPTENAEQNEKLEKWQKDLQQRMDRSGYDISITLNDDQTSFILRPSSETEKAMKDMKTVEGFAEKRGMQPASTADQGVTINIDRYIDKEGYLGPVLKGQSPNIPQAAGDNFAAVQIEAPKAPAPEGTSTEQSQAGIDASSLSGLRTVLGKYLTLDDNGSLVIDVSSLTKGNKMADTAANMALNKLDPSLKSENGKITVTKENMAKIFDQAPAIMGILKDAEQGKVAPETTNELLSQLEKNLPEQFRDKVTQNADGSFLIDLGEYADKPLVKKALAQASIELKDGKAVVTKENVTQVIAVLGAAAAAATLFTNRQKRG